MSIKCNTTYIGYNAFENCTNLTTINFTTNYNGNIDKTAFSSTPWFTDFTENASSNNIKYATACASIEKYLVVNECLLNYWTTETNTTMHIPLTVQYIQDNTLTNNEFMPQITNIVAEDQVRDYGWQNFQNTQ